MDEKFTCAICTREFDPAKDEWMTFYPRKQASVVICALNGLACVTKYYEDEEE